MRASIQFPAGDPELSGNPQEALADVLDLLVRLRPETIDFTMLVDPEGLIVRLGVDFGLSGPGRADILKTALVRSEGEAGFRVSFSDDAGPIEDWMLAVPYLDHPALPSGEPFGLPLQLEPALAAALRRLRLSGAAFGYRLHARWDEGSAPIARKLAPAIAACELRGGTGALLAPALHEALAVVRNGGWHVQEGLCLRKDASDSAADLLEAQIASGVRALHPFVPDEVLAIDWSHLDGMECRFSPEAGWQDKIGRRRGPDYPARALTAALGAARDGNARHAPPPVKAAGALVPPAPPGPYAFLSYAHRDRHQIGQLIDRLGEHGLAIWFDDHIEGGVAWDECLENRIRDCALLIACVSAAYEASRYCRREIKFADVLGKPILPVSADKYLWGPGLALMFNELQIVHRGSADWALTVAAEAKRLLSRHGINA